MVHSSKHGSFTFGEFSQVTALNVILRLKEYLPKNVLTDRIILQVEIIEPVEPLVGVHVESIDR